MMTKKLYYENPYIDSFTTNFIKQEVDENGNLYVVLEDTAFYPTGGGQPHDTGFLNECHVFNVEDIDGEIRHYLNKPLEETSEVNGSINWDRRFDHMQQHAGQHLLSAAFEELYNYKTVSFHLGKDFLTIDLDIQDLKEEESLRAEELANKIVLEGRAIETKWVTKEELSGYPLRKQVSVEDNIRLVIVPDFDYNGCGGTHPASTSQVGTIKILGWEKQGKKIRVQFICGNRVVMQFHNKNKVLTELSRLLSAPAEELAQTVVQLRETMKQLDKSLQEAKEELLQHEANALQQTSKDVNGMKIIAHTYQNRTVQELQKLGRFITVDHPNNVALLISITDQRLQFVCASGEETNVSMKEIASTILPLINGKGGGNARLAQGGGEFTASITPEMFLKRMEEAIISR